MPLHALPLCSLKYAGDTLSSATFQYDTAERVSKTDNKLLSCEYASIMEKPQDNKYMYVDAGELNKHEVILLQSKGKNIDILSSKELKLNESLNQMAKLDSISLNGPELLIEKLTNVELSNEGVNSLIIEETIPLKSALQMDIIQLESKFISRVDPPNIDLVHDKELSKPNNMSINIEHDLNLGSHSNTLIVIDDYIKQLNGQDIRDMQLKTANSYKYINDNKLINKHNYLDMCKFIKERVITQTNSNYFMYRFVSTQVYLNDKLRFLQDMSQESLYIKLGGGRLIYNITVKGIFKYSYIDALNRVNLKNVDKDGKLKHVYRKVVRPTFREEEKGLIRDVLVNTFRLSQNYLDRESIINTFKIDPSYLDRDTRVNIFKDYQKSIKRISTASIFNYETKNILDITIENIYSNPVKLIKDITGEVISKYNHKQFIDVISRWWWLNSTAPTDRLIVPNRDYGLMIDLLSNPNFEYLRYNNHPIDWGSDWGIDFHIPTNAISIETMLDVVNIITMIWHKNVQGWLSISGKEAIQLLMELLYDWYSMNTSNSNKDYYRTYRWIRWEAEKVYFLDTKNGLQAIGVLVANLRDYLKFHHFNKVPLWRNIKAMDEERNFNRLATNNDLMKAVDKKKGNRHYFIETQNFEKKDIFRR